MGVTANWPESVGRPWGTEPGKKSDGSGGHGGWDFGHCPSGSFGAMTTDSGPAIASMAALTKNAAERYAGVAAARFRREDEWAELTYAELWEQVRSLALGLIDLGVEAGDRVAILCNTRVEFSVADLAASTVGAIVVPVYPSNSPDECEWVVGDSGSKVIVCENAAQVAKIDAVRGGLPDLQHVLIIDGEAPGATPMADVLAAGAAGDESVIDARIAAVQPEDACLIIYTSGTTGRPKGVVLTNGGFAAGRHSAVEMALFGPGDVVYLYLPMAHVFAQLIHADCVEVGATIAYWGGDTTQIVPELGQVQPDRAAVRAAHLREGVCAGDGHGPARACRRGGAGDPARCRGPRRAAPRGDPSPRPSRRPSTPPTRRCSRSCAGSSAARSRWPSPARRRSPPRSSSSSTPPACPCSRGGA